MESTLFEDTMMIVVLQLLAFQTGAIYVDGISALQLVLRGYAFYNPSMRYSTFTKIPFVLLQIANLTYFRKCLFFFNFEN